jgi:hypothetical protein
LDSGKKTKKVGRVKTRANEQWLGTSKTLDQAVRAVTEILCSAIVAAGIAAALVSETWENSALYEGSECAKQVFVDDCAALGMCIWHPQDNTQTLSAAYDFSAYLPPRDVAGQKCFSANTAPWVLYVGMLACTTAALTSLFSCFMRWLLRRYMFGHCFTEHPEKSDENVSHASNFGMNVHHVSKKKVLIDRRPCWIHPLLFSFFLSSFLLFLKRRPMSARLREVWPPFLSRKGYYF